VNDSGATQARVEVPAGPRIAFSLVGRSRHRLLGLIGFGLRRVPRFRMSPVVGRVLDPLELLARARGAWCRRRTCT
jgi:hypothetical protein